MRAASITDYIPFGKENAVTRAHLRAATGLPDRKIREEIEQARRRGAIIINAQDGAGYYQSEDIKDISEAVQTERAPRPFDPCTAKAFTQALKRSWRNGGKEGCT